MAGAIFGSFIATLVLRWPEAKSLRGRSACDSCAKQLGAIELVPLLSYLALRGRCRHCNAPIDRFHFQVELTAGVIGAIALGLLPTIAGLLLAVMGWLLLPLFILDVRHLWLPDRLTALLALIGLAFAGFANELSLFDRALGGFVGAASLGLIAYLYRKTRGHDGMGSGDPKLFGAIGCWIGWQLLPVALLVGSAGLLAIVLLRGSARDGAAQHPLGAGLAVGGFLTFGWQLVA
ncbi:prepilin peptidase [Sphingomicrobium marinum]|uniref:prepilin peptidase n=1 Tax=Sphingomicrobium marinum TaxID=1227950 RepID=UPI00223F9496|nr:A24 family peptidase [Sphingomicrobium marinum]